MSLISYPFGFDKDDVQEKDVQENYKEFDDLSEDQKKEALEIVEEFLELAKEISKENGETAYDKELIENIEKIKALEIQFENKENATAAINSDDQLVIYPPFFDKESHINDTFLDAKELSFVEGLSLKELQKLTLRHEMTHLTYYNEKSESKCGINCTLNLIPWKDQPDEKHAERTAIKWAKKYLKKND